MFAGIPTVLIGWTVLRFYDFCTSVFNNKEVLDFHTIIHTVSSVKCT